MKLTKKQKEIQTSMVARHVREEIEREKEVARRMKKENIKKGKSK